MEQWISRCVRGKTYAPEDSCIKKSFLMNYSLTTLCKVKQDEIKIQVRPKY